jgi:hypothetical protein
VLTSFSRRSVIGSALVLLAGHHVQAAPIQTVFVVSMENTNWTQNANQFTGNQQQIFGNPAAPFLNSLVNGTLTTTVNGQTITSQTAYATAYHNVLSTPSGANPSIHPSEPNYIWAEGGTNFGVLNDNTPYGPGGTNQNTTQHLSTLLTNAGKTWKSYQEDIDLVKDAGGKLTSTVAPQSQWTVPLNNVSGSNPGSYVNPYNKSAQYDYAAKHNPQVFFSDTNGGNNTTPSNPLSEKYAPLQQLQTDLNNNTVANYNWITPDQFNDMHTALTGGFTYNGTLFTGGAAKIAQGDNFLSQFIPTLMASQAYQDNGAIVLWWDESEPDGTGNTNDFNHTIGEIVISELAHPNVNGMPFASSVNLTHSDDLRTMQNIFGVWQNGYLGDAANAQGLDSLFATGAVAAVSEPSELSLLLAGLGLIGFARRRNTE